MIEQEIVRRLNEELTYECQFEFEYGNVLFEEPGPAKYSFFVGLERELACEC